MSPCVCMPVTQKSVLIILSVDLTFEIPNVYTFGWYPEMWTALLTHAHQTCKRNWWTSEWASSLYPMECIVHLLTLFILHSHSIAFFSFSVVVFFLWRNTCEAISAIFWCVETKNIGFNYKPLTCRMFNAHSFGINYQFVCTQISYVFN